MKKPGVGVGGDYPRTDPCLDTLRFLKVMSELTLTRLEFRSLYT